MDRIHTLCFVGHRILPREDSLEQLKSALRNALNVALDEGYTTFLFGGNYGWDLLCAAEVIHLKANHPHITLCAIIPHENQAARWTSLAREQYYDTMPLCDEVTILQPHFDSQCHKRCNQYMVDHSSRVITDWRENAPAGAMQMLSLAGEAGLEIIWMQKSTDEKL